MAMATITSVDDGRIQVRVRRSARYEYLSKRWPNLPLTIGQKVEIKRQTNNPFPVLVRVLADESDLVTYPSPI